MYFLNHRRSPPWELLRGLGSRLHVLGCPEDIWMARWQYDEFVSTCPEAQAIWLDDVGHAYCTSAQQCSRVNSVICDMFTSKLYP